MVGRVFGNHRSPWSPGGRHIHRGEHSVRRACAALDSDGEAAGEDLVGRQRAPRGQRGAAPTADWSTAAIHKNTKNELTTGGLPAGGTVNGIGLRPTEPVDHRFCWTSALASALFFLGSSFSRDSEGESASPGLPFEGPHACAMILRISQLPWKL
ncbi:hypothetical protein BP00DRAFT_169261 [Aspergillus indologenus CBS 114.80]|uniref:Uncharacterized protein n=1 Tax=Aspergillus indologenus CBS 114.80 TaxID=1450541 RepID=A0A2V5IBX0_9EURO|nr:hypothetical protein BP00DRAFT_169261 [Aspergillus indologenus CBS 114.80]